MASTTGAIETTVSVYGLTFINSGNIYSAAPDIPVAVSAASAPTWSGTAQGAQEDPFLANLCETCPEKIVECTCDCAFLPSLEVLLAVVEKFADAVKRFYSPDVTLSPLLTRYTAYARMNDYTRARFLWIDAHPDTRFEMTNMTHRYALRDIYLAYQLSGMELDPMVNTLG